MRAGLLTAVALAAAFAASAPVVALANECDSEARSVENQLRARGGSEDPTAANRINRAQAMCRDSPLAGRAELDAIRRQMDQEAARPEPRDQSPLGQPPPLGQPWRGAGPGGAASRY